MSRATLDLECAERLRELLTEVQRIRKVQWANRFVTKQEAETLDAVVREMGVAAGRLMLRVSVPASKNEAA